MKTKRSSENQVQDREESPPKRFQPTNIGTSSISSSSSSGKQPSSASVSSKSKKNISNLVRVESNDKPLIAHDSTEISPIVQRLQDFLPRMKQANLGLRPAQSGSGRGKTTSAIDIVPIDSDGSDLEGNEEDDEEEDLSEMAVHRARTGGKYFKDSAAVKAPPPLIQVISSSTGNQQQPSDYETDDEEEEEESGDEFSDESDEEEEEEEEDEEEEEALVVHDQSDNESDSESELELEDDDDVPFEPPKIPQHHLQHLQATTLFNQSNSDLSFSTTSLSNSRHATTSSMPSLNSTVAQSDSNQATVEMVIGIGVFDALGGVTGGAFEHQQQQQHQQQREPIIDSLLIPSKRTPTTNGITELDDSEFAMIM